MSHLSLYRAFRPATFGEMVRQEHIVKILTNQIESDSVGHAYLFCGPRGTGKTTVARIFARAINCERPVNGSPCGECPTCKALSESGNLDVSEIDAASNNGVNEMRELREKVQYPPVSGKYKVYIIDEVHMLTDSAFNALLKTLEEPPRHAVFIMATTEPQKIPATILSRCMRLDFKLIPQADLEAHLKRILDRLGKPYEEEAVSAIALAGAGSDRDMLSIAEMCISYEGKLTYRGVTEVLGSADFSKMSDLCGAILQADTQAALVMAEGILAEGKSVGVLVKDILQFLNRAAIAKTCRNAEKLLAVPKDVFDKIDCVAKRAEGSAILRSTEIFAKAESDLRFVSSPRICVETAIVKASMPAADYHIDSLMTRISALEKQVKALSEGGVALSSQPQGAQTRSAGAQPQSEGDQPPQPTVQSGVSDDFGQADEPVMDEPLFVGCEEPFGGEGSFFAEVGESAHPTQPTAQPTQSTAQSKKPQSTVTGEVGGSGAAQTDFFSSPKLEGKADVGGNPFDRPAAPAQSAEVVFGMFMRKLRKMSKNGMLFTMCSDLEAQYEGGTLVLYTESPTVFQSLASYREIMAEAFALVGTEDFTVRLKNTAAEREGAKNAIEQLKTDFGDYPVEVK